MIHWAWLIPIFSLGVAFGFVVLAVFISGGEK
jgi:hypothetical protein